MGALDYIASLFTGNPEPQPQAQGQPIPAAPPLAHFPTRNDAEEARKYGFGYGSGKEAYLNNEAARVMGQDLYIKPPGSDRPKNLFGYRSGAGMDDREATDLNNSKNLDLTNPENAIAKQAVDDLYMRAALAANRIPVAGLGFEPRRMQADVMINSPTVFGFQNPKEDSIYFNTNRSFEDPKSPYNANGTPVHESIHRGLMLLRKNYPEAQEILNKLPHEEYIVRHLMNTQAGNPEETIAGQSDGKHPQIALAKAMFGKGHWDKEINRLNELAAQEIAKRHPAGPN